MWFRNEMWRIRQTGERLLFNFFLFLVFVELRKMFLPRLVTLYKKAVAAQFKALNANPEAKPISHLHTTCIFEAVKILNASPLPYPRYECGHPGPFYIPSHVAGFIAGS